MFTNKNNKLYKCTNVQLLFFYLFLMLFSLCTIKSSNTPTPKSGNIFRNLHELVDKIN